MKKCPRGGVACEVRRIGRDREKWYLFVDETARRGYIPFQTDSLEDPHWSMPSAYNLPRSPRHGTVLPVTKAELERLRQTYGAVTTAP